MEAHLNEILRNALKTGVERDELLNITKMKKKSTPRYLVAPTNYKYYLFITTLIAVLATARLPNIAFRRPIEHLKELFMNRIYSPNGNCLVAPGEYAFEMFRPVINCDMCKEITEVPVFYNMTKEYFIKHHAYTGIPVLIKGGAKDWTALNVFSYKYFKQLYTEMDALDEFDEKECQFFGYKTNLRTLKHVFKMSKKRASLRKDQWYIGWSNCIEKVQNKLREHYTRPTFLPEDSESSSLDWLFMGGSGTGAMMHIDSVNRPSWQAMITGKKTWYIEPPPECEFKCSKHLSATMEQGDILVIDTNRWYHSTFIYPGQMAITIGSEYD